MTDPLLNSCLLLNMISLLFFLFSLHSPIAMFIVLHVKQKRSPNIKIKTRENNFENKSKNTSHGQFNFHKRSTK